MLGRQASGDAYISEAIKLRRRMRRLSFKLGSDQSDEIEALHDAMVDLEVRLSVAIAGARADTYSGLQKQIRHALKYDEAGDTYYANKVLRAAAALIGRLTPNAVHENVAAN